MKTLKAKNLKCEYRTNPLGIDVKQPRFSWQIESCLRGTMQTAYRLQISLNKSDFDEVIWDSSYTESDQSIHIEYNGPELWSKTRYFYRVKVWDNHGHESDWTEPSWFETALFDSDEWQANWITPDQEKLDPLAECAFLLRKEFSLKQRVHLARIYATGVGLYELYLNGQRVGEDLLTPGWTSYTKRIQYQTYDVTHLINRDTNALGFMLADGWYKGNLAWEEKRHLYGDRRAVLLQLHVTYEDGTEEVIVTDPTWKASTGPILFSELYHGETYDARLEQEGWSDRYFNDEDWSFVTFYDPPVGRLVAQENNPTRVTEILHPQAKLVTPAGDIILDMGQNMVGRMRLKIQAQQGTKITLKHAEILDKDGNIYFGNLRTAKQTVTYIAKGSGIEEYAPHFTFQGFRYVKVEGFSEFDDVSLEQFVGEVIHSDMDLIGEFETSDAMVNQLQKNTVWGQRGNFVDVPTDCPQRDERLGWTGDAQVFISTALFNYHGAQFFTKWLHDLKADQLSNGGVPFVIPNVLDGHSSTGWGDAATICPWQVYQSYGDKRLLEDQYESMKAWIDYIRKQGDNEYLWNTGFHFGDWLALDAKEDSYFGATPNDLVATAYYAYSTRIVLHTARVLNQKEDEKQYQKLLNNIIQEFRNEFITPAGRLAVSTQTAYVLTLMFDLAEEKDRKRLAFDLNELVLENDYHLKTGFVGTPYICFVLSKNGYHKTALRLLLQKTYPSWLYPITKGATTIWEHWDGIKTDGSFWSDDMNSFNHYAYGAIGDWLYRVVAGLDMDPSVPAYKRIHIAPKISSKELTSARAVYQSMYGEIISSWNVTPTEVKIEVKIPVNTTATLLLPNARFNNVKDSNIYLKESKGIISYTETDDGVQLEVGSGHYRFVYPNEKGFEEKISRKTKIIDLIDVEQYKPILEESLPELTKLSDLQSIGKKQTLNDLINQPMIEISHQQMDNLIEKLNLVTK